MPSCPPVSRRLWKLLPVLGALPLLMGAEVYRWVDENGVVNYTQLAPEGVEAERVRPDTGQRIAARPSEPATTPAAESAEPELSEAQQRMLSKLQAAEQARQEEVARIKQANCERARAVLERLSVHGRVRVRGEDGQERVMPEDERQQRIDEAQQGVAANCNDVG